MELLSLKWHLPRYPVQLEVPQESCIDLRIVMSYMPKEQPLMRLTDCKSYSQPRGSTKLKSAIWYNWQRVTRFSVVFWARLGG